MTCESGWGWIAGWPPDGGSGGGGGGEGSGDVTGPASSTDNAIARFNGTTGKVLQNSAVTIGDAGEIAGYRAHVRTISGTTGSVDVADTGKIVDTTSNSAVAIEFDNQIPVDACGTIQQLGDGQITFSVESGGTLRNRSSHTKSAGKYAFIAWRCIANSGGSAAEIAIGGDTAA
jgi:hypothetical protein